jgi:hypothetical protein
MDSRLPEVPATLRPFRAKHPHRVGNQRTDPSPVFRALERGRPVSRHTTRARMSISTPRPQTGSLPLCEATLHVHASHVRVPTYDRSTLTPGVVHLGVGAFHRAHQAVYLDDLAERGFSTWGVVGVALRRRAMKEALEPQDGLFTVVSRGPRGDDARVIGSLLRVLFAP